MLDQPVHVSGGAPAESGILARWENEELASFSSEPLDPSGVKIRSPRFEPPIAAAARVRIRVKPGGATRVRVIPFGTGMEQELMQRTHRAVELPLERDADPDQPVDLVVDVSEALHGNWTDAATAPGLTRLEVDLPGAEPDRIGLERILVEDQSALFADAPAGVRRVERDGIVRPSWYVNAGASLRVRFRVPDAPSELRWHEAATGGSAAAVRLLAGGSATPLESSPAGLSWRSHRADLRSWAGREVEVEFSSSGGGTSFFGDPRLVTPVDSGSTPDVLVYLIDTLRADSLGAYGSPLRLVSPSIDAMAAEGVVFARAFSNSSWTKPAIATLMTGLHPITHGVGGQAYTDQLPEKVPLLQQALRDGGWRTGSFAASPLGTTLSALDRGFGAAYTPRRWRQKIRDLEHPEAGDLHSDLLAWIDEEPEIPFFAYVHTLEVHEWYRDRFRRDLEPGWEPYDASIRAADRLLGELVQALGSRPRPLLVVVVSDHGESFGEHGYQGHGTSLHQSQVHVPLIFWASDGLPAMTVHEPVGLLDVAPTILDLLGLPPLPGIDGRTLSTWVREGLPGRPPVDVSSELMRFVWTPDAPPWRSLVTPNGVKLLRKQGSPLMAFDLESDPCERRPSPELAERLGARLAHAEEVEAEWHRRFVGTYGYNRQSAIDDADVERLRALGYVE